MTQIYFFNSRRFALAIIPRTTQSVYGTVVDHPRASLAESDFVRGMVRLYIRHMRPFRALRGPVDGLVPVWRLFHQFYHIPYVGVCFHLEPVKNNLHASV